MFVLDSHVWYFDSGASKHITSQRDMFPSLDSAPTGNSITCVDNSSYLVEGVGEIVLDAANGGSFILHDVLYVLGIKKNLVSVSALAKVGLVVKFMDDRCTVHDLSSGDTIVASGSLSRGLYKLDAYVNCVEDVACAASDLKAVSDAKLWHAHFGNLNFASLMHSRWFSESCSQIVALPNVLCGPMQTPSIGNYLYFVTFIDDYSKHAWVYPLKAKSKAFFFFK